MSIPLVSVVTPVYNGEAFLEACIESVLAQSFTDWEFVILNNCSTDRSLEIAERYAARDARIRVHSNTAVIPVIANFNRAASLRSQGTGYLKFLCADDVLFPDCLQQMVGLAESRPEVQLVACYKIHGNEPVCEGPSYPETVVNGKDVCRWFFQGKLGVLGSPTDHLIRLPTISIDGQIFDEKYLHADIEFFVRLLSDGAAYGFVHQVLTFTRVHGAQVSAFAHVMGTFSVEILAMLNKDGPRFFTEAEQQSASKALKRAYGQFLFRARLKLWDRRIWKHQVESWKKFDVKIGPLDVIGGGLREVGSSILSPSLISRRITRELERAQAK